MAQAPQLRNVRAHAGNLVTQVQGVPHLLHSGRAGERDRADDHGEPGRRQGLLGEVAEGERALAPFKASCPPAVDLVGPMPYVALQSMLDATSPHGWQFYDRLHYLDDVSDDFIDALISGFEQVPTPQTHVVTGWLGGRIGSVDPGDTAFGHRGARAFTWIIGCSGAEPVEPVTAWVREVWDATAPFATGGVYVNALDAGRPARDAFADEVWERLLTVKRRYDPDGVFAGSGIR